MNTMLNIEGQTYDLDAMLAIRATSGGERGTKGSGTQHAYEIKKETWLSMAGEIFDREKDNSKEGNAKSGGSLSQFLHSYGVTADKMAKSGENPFPQGGEFAEDAVDTWLRIMDFRAPRGGGKRKSQKDVRVEAALSILALPGMTWAVMGAAFPDLTEEEVLAYKAKGEASVEEATIPPTPEIDTESVPH